MSRGLGDVYKRQGVYPAQRIVSPKRRSLIVDEGHTVAEAIERHNDLIE